MNPRAFSNLNLGSVVSTDLIDYCANEVVEKGAALAAWRAEHSGPLADLIEQYDNRTIGSDMIFKRPASVRCLASVNMT